MKKLALCMLIAAFLPHVLHAQTLQQEGHGTFLSIPGLAFEFGSNQLSMEFAMHHRLTKRLDVGAFLAYSGGWKNNSAVHTASRGHSLTVGPVVGYSRAIGNSMGIRTSLLGYLSYSNLAPLGPHHQSLRFSGYGGQAEVSIYKQFRVGSVALSPSVGSYTNVSSAIGPSMDHYSYVRHAPAGTSPTELRGWLLNTGVRLQLPISVGIGGDTKFSLVPSYSIDTYNSLGDHVMRPGLAIRIRF